MLDKHLYFPPSKKEDLIYGKNNERDVLPLLEKFFNEPLEKTENEMDTTDFVGHTIDMELKSRRIPHNKYATALVGENKILARDKSRYYYVVWKYTDGLFYLKYDEELWNTFKVEEFQRGQRTDCYDRPSRVYHIPYRHLHKLEF